MEDVSCRFTRKFKVSSSMLIIRWTMSFAFALFMLSCCLRGGKRNQPKPKQNYRQMFHGISPLELDVCVAIFLERVL